MGCNTITLLPGHYRVAESLTLDKRDSGLTISAAPGERPLIEGAIEIAPSEIHSCVNPAVLAKIIDSSARKDILEVNLAKVGVATLAPLMSRGTPYSPTSPVPNELFQGDNVMTLARWPNGDYSTVGKVLEKGDPKLPAGDPRRLPSFLCGDRAKLWVSADDPWLYGYWGADWADESIKIQQVNPATGAVTLEHPHPYGVATGAKFYAENLLEELDAPGEYFIDRKSSMLYFIALHNPTLGEPLRISMLSDPLVAIGDAAKIVIKGIDFGFSRGCAIRIRNCENVRVEGCTFEGLGTRAAEIDEGHDSGLEGCDISDTGEGGARISGGDRNSLAAARNFVENCEIRNFERRSQTYRPAVALEGVGNRVAHCFIHDAPHAAIVYNGNDHIIEYNHFARTLQRTGDGGVIYTGRDWTGRGTIIRSNWFDHNFGLRKWEPAIYFDDMASGNTAYGNLIESGTWGVFVGGGRDNVVEANIVSDCSVAFKCDDRGLSWTAFSTQQLPTLMQKLKGVPYQSPVWQGRYPGMSAILEGNPLEPVGNVLRGNTAIRCGAIIAQLAPGFLKFGVVAGNQETGASSPAETQRIVEIRAASGLINDDLRKSITKRPIPQN